MTKQMKGSTHNANNVISQEGNELFGCHSEAPNNGAYTLSLRFKSCVRIQLLETEKYHITGQPRFTAKAGQPI
jgi:hypothetical protein